MSRFRRTARSARWRSVRRAVVAAAALWALSGDPGAAQTRLLSAMLDGETVSHDALHYDVWIELADSGSRFRAAVTTRWRIDGTGPIRIDLDSVYRVTSLTLDGQPVRFTRQGQEILVPVAATGGGEVETRIEYHGSPPPFERFRSGSGRPDDDGLVQRGRGPDRRIFADNWPDRARKWLAAQDHPSDKATVSWTIDAPAHLTVVANGALTGTEAIDAGRRRWRFTMEQPIPVYTMVIGAARLAVTPLEPACAVRCVPVSIYTYPADSAWAVSGPFRRAGEMVDYFSRLIAPYPYAELRHVQSSTIFGGMENSTVVFYDEQGYARRSLGEGTVAHETAHQWFGNSATERDWYHLWLSEGFATYATALWNGHVGGEAALRRTMADARRTVLGSAVRERPILDTTVTDRMQLLNPNNYQKGGWVLHTLRGLVGDSAFFRGLRRYYDAFAHGTALSGDFASIMSEESGTDLTWYFTQALTQPGYPVLRTRVTGGGGTATVTLEQVQPPAWGQFRMPNLELRMGDQIVTVPVEERTARVTLPWTGSSAPSITIDPNGWWLLEVEAGEGH